MYSFTHKRPKSTFAGNRRKRNETLKQDKNLIQQSFVHSFRVIFFFFSFNFPFSLFHFFSLSLCSSLPLSLSSLLTLELEIFLAACYSLKLFVTVTFLGFSFDRFHSFPQNLFTKHARTQKHCKCNLSREMRKLLLSNKPEMWTRMSTRKKNCASFSVLKNSV